MSLPDRKHTRLPGFDYSAPGYYFITFCTRDKKNLLCTIVGTGVLDGPEIHFTPFGKIALKHMEAMRDFYEDIKVEKYVIMPNHVHLLIRIPDLGSGPSGTPVPTDSKIARFVSTFKRFCNKDCKAHIWQSRSHDHVIRGESDYQKIWSYIDNNPAKWTEDCFYIE